jgi:uncharacterized protein (TIGR02145 family)
MTGGRGSYIAGEAPGDKMKVNSSNTPAWDGNNASGFTALPGGYNSFTYGYGFGFGSYVFFWTATEADLYDQVWHRMLKSASGLSDRSFYYKRDGYSVRCLQN